MNGVFPEWLNANAGRAYPLSESATRRDITGHLVLPDSLIVAAQINMLPAWALGEFFISEVSCSPSNVKITIGYVSGGSQRNVASVNVPVSTHVENSTYAFVGSGQDSSVLGSLTVGQLNEALESLPGVVTFQSASTPFEVSALFVSSPAVEAIEVYSGADLIGRFTGVLKLRAGENIRLSYVDDDPDVIRIDAVSGENLVEPSDCANAPKVYPCIRTINQKPADADGNFTIDGGKCIDVTVTNGQIKLSDLCSQSCCGCTELEALVAGLQGVEAQILQLRLQIDSTVIQQSQMIVNLSASLR